MKKQACVAFQTEIIRSVTALELTEEQRYHIEDCSECEDAYMNACPRWRAHAQIEEEPAVRLLDFFIDKTDDPVTNAAKALQIMGLPKKYLPLIARAATKRTAIN